MSVGLWLPLVQPRPFPSSHISDVTAAVAARAASASLELQRDLTWPVSLPAQSTEQGSDRLGGQTDEQGRRDVDEGSSLPSFVQIILGDSVSA